MERPCQAQRILEKVAIRNASGIANGREMGHRDQDTVDEEGRAGYSMHGGSQSISLPLGRHYCETLRFQVVIQDSHGTEVSSHRHQRDKVRPRLRTAKIVTRTEADDELKKLLFCVSGDCCCC